MPKGTFETVKREVKSPRKVTTNVAQPGMDDMYAVDGQRHAWAGHSCGAVQDQALKFFPYASPSGKAEGSADMFMFSCSTQTVNLKVHGQDGTAMKFPDRDGIERQVRLIKPGSPVC